MTFGPKPNCSSWRFFAFSVISFRPSSVCKQRTAFAACIFVCCYLRTAVFAVLRNPFVWRAVDAFQDVHVVHCVDHPVSAFTALVEMPLSFRFPRDLQCPLRGLGTDRPGSTDTGSGQRAKELITVSVAVREYSEVCGLSVHDGHSFLFRCRCSTISNLDWNKSL